MIMRSKTWTALLLAFACGTLAILLSSTMSAQQSAAPATPPAAPAQGAPAPGPGAVPAAPGQPGQAGFPGGRGRGPQITRPQGNFSTQQIVPAWPWDVTAMEDALPSKPYATPKQPRKILVLCKASGF